MPGMKHGQNSAAYVVFSFAYWHSRFQGDRGVLGRIVQIDKHPFTVIGVAPPEFRGTLFFVSPDFFVPIVDRSSRWAEEMFRLTQRSRRRRGRGFR